MTMAIAIVGVGKIARDQHLPTIAASDRFTLAGVVSSHADDLNVPAAASLTALKRQVPDLAAASICTPPMGRAAVIAEALWLGLDVMIEKPPAATISEAEQFAALARDAGRALYLTWHSREANGVEPLRQWLAGRTVRRIAIEWMEDVRVWHPGQEWIWQPGIGVFDPGINALSILTQILPAPVFLTKAELSFPANRAAPIAAEILDESIALSEKRYDVAVKPMTPAVGSFQFIENINFKTDVGNYVSAASLIADIKPAAHVEPSDPADAERDETSASDDSTPPPPDANTDTDRTDVAAATPKIKTAPDDAGRVRKTKRASSSSGVAASGASSSTPPEGANAATTGTEGQTAQTGDESAMMRSMRKFFRRGGEEESSPEAVKQLKVEQKNLRKQQKAQQTKLQPFQPQQPQPQPTPKKKKFLFF